MLADSYLKEIVKQEDVTTASHVLDLLQTNVRNTFEHSEQDDGMEIGLIAINREKKILQYAAAHHNLYLIRDGELTEYKADRMSISKDQIHNNKPFTNHVIDIQDGDLIYLFSDGYRDQL